MDSESHVAFFAHPVPQKLQPVFLSLRNSHDMNLHLLRESQSRSLIVNGAHSEVATRIKAQLPSILTIDADQVDPHSGILLDLKELSSPTQEEYLVEKECSCYVMHTSGSTGAPRFLVPGMNETNISQDIQS